MGFVIQKCFPDGPLLRVRLASRALNNNTNNNYVIIVLLLYYYYCYRDYYYYYYHGIGLSICTFGTTNP